MAQRIFVFIWVLILALAVMVAFLDVRPVYAEDMHLGDCIDTPEEVIEIFSIFNGPVGREKLQAEVFTVPDDPLVFQAWNIYDIAVIVRDGDVDFEVLPDTTGREVFIVYGFENGLYIEYREDWVDITCRVEIIQPPAPPPISPSLAA